MIDKSLPLTESDKKTLLSISREHIQVFLTTGKNLRIDETVFSEPLQQIRGNYVRLILDNKTRGAVGNVSSHLPLVSDVVQNAYDAAFEDPRFAPITRDEILETHIQITLLTTPKPMNYTNEQELLELLTPGKDGLILQEGAHSSHLLPSAWSEHQDREQFLCSLKRKAGLSADYWSSGITLLQFETSSFRD